MTPAEPHVAALARSGVHGFSKQTAAQLVLIAGEGVMGDAHAGRTVKHRSRVAIDPSQPNLRQVSLLSAELLTQYAAAGFCVRPGEMGENVLTAGIDLHALPRGARMQLGPTAAIKVTGLRNPCAQIDNFRPGLLDYTARKTADGRIERRAGVMAIVVAGGAIAVGDAIVVTLPPQPWAPLERV